MGNTVLNEYLIKNSEYYDMASPYAENLKKKGITTIEQLLGMGEMEQYKGLQRFNRVQLQGFIDMLEYKYKGKSLPYTKLMECYIAGPSTYVSADLMFNTNKPREEIVSVIRLLGCSLEEAESICNSFWKDLANGEIASEDYGLPLCYVKLKDFLRYNKIQQNPKLAIYANTYLEALNKIVEENKSSREALEKLRSSLEEQKINNKILSCNPEIAEMDVDLGEDTRKI